MTGIKYWVKGKGRALSCEVEEKETHLYHVCCNKKKYILNTTPLNPYLVRLEEPDGTFHYLFWEKKGQTYHVHIRGFSLKVEVSKHYEKLVREERKLQTGPLTIESPIPGLITKIYIRPGEHVEKGKSVLSLSAMKLENEILSPERGEVLQILVKENQQVDKGQPLVTLQLHSL